MLQGRSTDAHTCEDAIAELRNGQDAEGEEVRGDPAPPADTAWDVDDEVARRKDEEDGERIAEERGPRKATLQNGIE